MRGKRESGKYYTASNPFEHELFRKWFALTPTDSVILEPFAGVNSIPKMMDDIGYHNKWVCYDIDWAKTENKMPEFTVRRKDTIKNFPTGFNVCVTNPPYIGKSSARRRKIEYTWDEDDLYKVCLKLMLDNCEYVAAIIPESFITANFRTERLWGVISLAYRMFDDTDCPVCLALFTPNGRDDVEIYVNDEKLGHLSDLSNEDFIDSVCKNSWRFNDKHGNIGVKTVDGVNGDLCHFCHGDTFKPESIKVSSRSFTRISGLPDDIDFDTFIARCNQILSEYRERTKDVTLTSFKGLRSDGRYRRRLDFKVVRFIMNKVLCELRNNN